MFGSAVEVGKALHGVLSGRRDTRFDGVSTDSRSIRTGELYIALKGVRFDGHVFVSDVFKKGASGVIVNSTWQGSVPAGRFIVRVHDTTSAFGELARYWRRKVAPVVIGISGSCGKTTTKELTAAVIESSFPVLKNHANLNNYYGVSQTLLRLRKEKYAVVEMGINNRNEMDELTAVAEPDLGLVTNIGPVHLEGLKSLRDIYNEKKILLDKSGSAVFVNADDRFLRSYKAGGSKQEIRFGRSGSIIRKRTLIRDLDAMTVLISDAARKPAAEYLLNFPYAGLGLSSNIAAAAAIGRYVGISWGDIREAVASVRLPALRMQTMRIGKTRIIMDAYNANPVSMKNAVNTFLRLEGRRKSVVLGDMKELGRWCAYYHRLLGIMLAKAGLTEICLIGHDIKTTWQVLREMKVKNVKYCHDADEFKPEFCRLVDRSDLVLIKASRAIGLEKLVSGGCDAV